MILPRTLNRKLDSLLMTVFVVVKLKVKVGTDQEMAQSERNSHSKNRVGKKLNQQIRYLY